MVISGQNEVVFMEKHLNYVHNNTINRAVEAVFNIDWIVFNAVVAVFMSVVAVFMSVGAVSEKNYVHFTQKSRVFDMNQVILQ